MFRYNKNGHVNGLNYSGDFLFAYQNFKLSIKLSHDSVKSN